MATVEISILGLRTLVVSMPGFCQTQMLGTWVSLMAGLRCRGLKGGVLGHVQEAGGVRGQGGGRKVGARAEQIGRFVVVGLEHLVVDSWR